MSRTDKFSRMQQTRHARQRQRKKAQFAKVVK